LSLLLCVTPHPPKMRCNSKVLMMYEKVED
jgi:hypothetical protein